MTAQSYAVRFSAPAAKVLDALPERAEEVVWTSWTLPRPTRGAFAVDADDPEGEDVRLASVGQPSLTYWINRPLHRLSVLNIVWLGQPPGDGP
ncbi:hypothetical protein [Streptomyces sp. NPDC006510]|uniref:hypothetical protein n=1 Tax=Streptomyces sp. NPDC006510 TaxID=3155600 RepID=UPI0033B5FDC9